MKHSLNKMQKIRQDANALYLKGRVLEALKIYKQLISAPSYAKKTNFKEKIKDLRRIISMFSYLSMYNEAVSYAKKLFELDPDDFYSILTLSINYSFAREHQKALDLALKAKNINENEAVIYDILSKNYMHLNRFEEAKNAGMKALMLKEKEAEQYPAFLVDQNIVKPFDKDNKHKNIISFTLFGNIPKYCENAIYNAKKASTIYPSWSCRFYCAQNVPAQVIQRLKDNGAEVIIKPIPIDIKDMLFWRFLVMSDKNIDRYLVRDCDSVINQREAIAVEEWIKSNKSFHIMRDFYTHTDLIMAGMFGGVSGIFNNIEELIKNFHSQVHSSRTHLDQKFLSQKVWPTIKNDVLIHDSCFHDENTLSIDFPQTPNQDKNFHVGINEAIATIDIRVQNWQHYKNVKFSIYDKTHNLICSYNFKLFKEYYSVALPTRYAKKIQNREYFIKSEPY